MTQERTRIPCAHSAHARPPAQLRDAGAL